jgi:hypothetical protein
MKLTYEQLKTLATIYSGEKGMSVSEGGHIYVVFAIDDIPGLPELVEQGYLLQRPNPLYENPDFLDERLPENKGSRMSYALTMKGRMVARKIPLAPELKNYQQPMRQARLKKSE